MIGLIPDEMEWEDEVQVVNITHQIQPILSTTLSRSLTWLHLGSEFNERIAKGSLPHTLTQLSFGKWFNQPLNGVLPTQLLTLHLGSDFNQPFTAGSLPDSIKELKFGYSFNQPLYQAIEGMFISVSIWSKIMQGERKPFQILNKTASNILVVIHYQDALGGICQSIHFKLDTHERERMVYGPNANTIAVGLITLDNSAPRTINYFFFDKLQECDLVIRDAECDGDSQTPATTIAKDHFYNPIVLDQKSYYRLFYFQDSSNKVSLVITEDLCNLYVLKEVDYSLSLRLYESAFNEIKAMKLLEGHHNFVEYVYHEEITNEKKIKILFEYCLNGDLNGLYDRVVALNGGLVLGDLGCCKFIDRLIQEKKTGQEKLDQEKQDENITCTLNSKRVDQQIDCYDDDDEPSVVITPELTRIAELTRGTLGYLSPETIHKQYGKPCDMYSIGSTIHKLLTWYENKNIVKISPKRYSQELIDFVNWLLMADPVERGSLQAILYHQRIKNERQMSMGYYLNIPITCQFPHYITNLTIDSQVNSDIRGMLPPTITVLKLLGRFNQPIEKDMLPPSLLFLEFGDSFQSNIEPMSLPTSLKEETSSTWKTSSI
ncbi:hypothetical protein DFA_00201 [Cavenderia fasciculata]|uniref:Protein kinase domain-containing protein n=1 Tax=Cavenderia fasciculata TaxID=261658 RepID=F4PXW3_CACFS|nr:uncharacterized protein DFA_00201 [Cavenderia fasciculata]EGG19623.1 hypothetical protein DFA_00201 [Cavenderia fasciculata]|eukprot:XP_004357917.1 hypothetical protein DFA_00201 [Cavenderia fasciculata]